jgi:hypothetical protein
MLGKKERTNMRKLKGMLAGLAMVAATSGAPVAFGSTCGDINNSGAPDPADSVILVQRIFGGPVAGDCGGLGTNQCGDINGSTGLDVGDLGALLDLINNIPIIFNCTLQATVTCPASVTGTITSNQTWGPSGCEVLIDGTTFVSSGVLLSIKPGVTVRGKKGAATPSALVFLRGAKINAPGEPDEPIIFTSNQASPSIGDWGGIVLNGRAPVNCAAGNCLAEGLSGIEFGGTDPQDNSGVLQYARIEYSGIELSADNELNILTMNGVGRGTLMDHIQVNHGFDDGFEWFGGTVNMNHLVASSVGDDDFDWQIGFTGSVQFGLGIKNAANSDTNGRHGFEADNNENGFGLLPRSNPKFCNMTLVGTRAQGQTSGSGRRGILFRRGTAGKVQNSIIDDYTQSGIQMDDNATAEQACVAGPALKTTEPFLLVKDSVVFGNGANTSGNAASPCTPAQWFGLLPGISTADPLIGESPYPTGGASDADQYVPLAGSSAAGKPDCAVLDPGYFTSATYAGAFAPGTGAAGNWLRDGDVGAGKKWIRFDTTNTTD